MVHVGDIVKCYMSGSGERKLRYSKLRRVISIVRINHMVIVDGQ